MHRGAWWAIVLWGSQRVGHDLMTKQQQISALADSVLPSH